MTSQDGKSQIWKTIENGPRGIPSSTKPSTSQVQPSETDNTGEAHISSNLDMEKPDISQ